MSNEWDEENVFAAARRGLLCPTGRKPIQVSTPDRIRATFTVALTL
jgi:hypothetical protein